MDGYDNGGTLPPGVTQVGNHPDIESSLMAGHAYIQSRYGPEQVLGPAEQARLRKAFKEQS